MKCEVCEHWTTRHAPIEGKKNVHYCNICKSECTFPGLYYERGSVLEPNSKALGMSPKIKNDNNELNDHEANLILA
jgi:hypothetical protein